VVSHHSNTAITGLNLPAHFTGSRLFGPQLVVAFVDFATALELSRGYTGYRTIEISEMVAVSLGVAVR